MNAVPALTVDTPVVLGVALVVVLAGAIAFALFEASTHGPSPGTGTDGPRLDPKMLVLATLASFFFFVVLRRRMVR